MALTSWLSTWNRGRVIARLFEDRVEVLYGGQVQLVTERLRGPRKRRIDYRHVISWLVKKPGAFARYKYREEMFPTLIFRRAYDRLSESLVERQAALEYLRVLHLAASTMESEVERVLTELLAAGEVPLFDLVLPLAEPRPSFVAHCHPLAGQADDGGWGFRDYLLELCEVELQERRERKIERLRRSSHLPGEKTLATLEEKRLPTPVRRQLPVLCEGGFVERSENLLAFGLPGRGKTHVVCAIGHELVKQGYQVLFTPTYRLVQRLLAAKRDLALPAQLRKMEAVLNPEPSPH